MRAYRVPLEEFPPSLRASAAAVAVDAQVAIPVYPVRLEAWLGAIPPGFCAVPSKHAVALRAPRDGPVASYPELAIRAKLEVASWSAVWVKNWGGRSFWQGIDKDGGVIRPLPPKAAELIEVLDAAVIASLEVEGRALRRPPGGCWDILGWRRGQWLFVEVKKPQEALKETQIRWLGAALASGHELGSFAIAEYLIGLPSSERSR